MDNHNDLEGLFLKLIEDSKAIVKIERRRSNIFLFSSILIAFGGIFYFVFSVDPEMHDTNLRNMWSRSSEDVHDLFANDLNLTNWLIAIIPRTIAFIFIEYFAFYFLKVYRTSLNDLTHYNSVLKIREDNYLVFKFYDQNKDALPKEFLLDKLNLFNEVDIIKNGESSKHIELQKLSKDETAFIEGILETIVKLKRR